MNSEKIPSITQIGDSKPRERALEAKKASKGTRLMNGSTFSYMVVQRINLRRISPFRWREPESRLIEFGKAFLNRCAITIEAAPAPIPASMWLLAFFQSRLTGGNRGNREQRVC